MIDAGRRAILVATLGLPATAFAAAAGTPAAAAPLLLFDPATAAGRRFAAHAARGGARPQAIAGDRVRFAAAVLAPRPALIVGVSRHADQLLIAGAAAELGYRQYLAMDRTSGTPVARGRGSWDRAGRMMTATSPLWPELLAELVVGGAIAPAAAGRVDADDASGWLLARPA